MSGIQLPGVLPEPRLPQQRIDLWRDDALEGNLPIGGDDDRLRQIDKVFVQEQCVLPDTIGLDLNPIRPGHLSGQPGVDALPDTRIPLIDQIF